MTPQAVVAPRRANGGLLVAGLALGYALSRIGFTDLDEVTRMFTFADARLFLVFALAVALTAAGLAGTGRWRAAKRPLTARAVVGGVLFGVGWAVAGACPGVAFAQVGEGKLWALVTLAGLALGTVAARVAQRRAKLPPTPACGDV